MEIDRSWLECAEQALLPLTILRFYQWSQPTVSLGQHQKPEEALEIRYCQQRSIPIIRRPTGGRAVFHAHELTYALVSNDRSYFPLHSVTGTYGMVARALHRGLENLGIDVQLAAGTQGRRVSSQGGMRSPCFTSVSRHELVSGGRKIAGSAQRRLRHSFLQHGSIPLSIDYQTMSAALGVDPKELQSKVISVSEAAARHLSFGLLAEALRRGFEEVFAVQLKPETKGPGLRLTGGVC